MANYLIRQLIYGTDNVNRWIKEKYISEQEVVAEQNRLEKMKKGPANDEAFQKQVKAIFDWKAKLLSSMRKLREATESLEEFLMMVKDRGDVKGTDDFNKAIEAVKEAKKVLTDSN